MKIDIPNWLILEMYEYIALEEGAWGFCTTEEQHEYRLRLMQMKKEQIADIVLTILKIQIKS